MNDKRSYQRAVGLLNLYVPFLLLVIGVSGYIVYRLSAWAWMLETERGYGIGILAAALPLGLFVLILTLIPPCLSYFRPVRIPDPYELQVPPRAVKGLRKLVRSVAKRQSLPMPDEIRLHVESVAHVYEEGRGSETARILVIGGSALASLDRKALEGVIAHELGHFAGGDTSLSHRAYRRHWTMLHVEHALARKPWNPLGWLLRGYHHLFRLAWAANQREQEYAADRFQVQQIGAKETAKALIAVFAIEEMPWSRLSSIAEWFAVMRSRNVSIFHEQVRRARKAKPSDWQDACRRALKEKTKPFDSHPSLRERLKAMGVSPKKAIALAAEFKPGDAEPAEYIQNWDAIDEVMSSFLVGIVQSVQEQKRELAEMILGRSVG